LKNERDRERQKMREDIRAKMRQKAPGEEVKVELVGVLSFMMPEPVFEEKPWKAPRKKGAEPSPLLVI
jgi:hypothetical protein